MIDVKWKTEPDPIALLKLGDDRFRDHHYRRCAAAWCRLLVPLLTSEYHRRLVDRLEQVVAGTESPDSLHQLRWQRDDGWNFTTGRAEQAVSHAMYPSWRHNPYLREPYYHRQALLRVGHHAALAWACHQIGSPPHDVHVDHPWHADFTRAYHEARPMQANLVRCVIPNPFYPVTPDPMWRTSTALAIARGIYESRDFSPMPILADALQDAGCENADLLDHCRGDGPHVRGCWVVDLVLGKT